MVIEMSNGQNIRLDREDIKIDLSEKPEAYSMKFQFRNSFGALVISEVRCSPHEIYHLLISFKLRKMVLDIDGQMYQIGFNLHISKLDFSEERTIGFYEISPVRSSV